MINVEGIRRSTIIKRMEECESPEMDSTLSGDEEVVQFRRTKSEEWGSNGSLSGISNSVNSKVCNLNMNKNTIKRTKRRTKSEDLQNSKRGLLLCQRRVRLGSVFGFGLKISKIPAEVLERLGEDKVEQLVKGVNSIVKEAHFSPLKLIESRMKHKQMYYYSTIYEKLEPYLNEMNQSYQDENVGVYMSIDSRYKHVLANHETFYIIFQLVGC